MWEGWRCSRAGALEGPGRAGCDAAPRSPPAGKDLEPLSPGRMEGRDLWRWRGSLPAVQGGAWPAEKPRLSQPPKALVPAEHSRRRLLELVVMALRGHGLARALLLHEAPA